MTAPRTAGRSARRVTLRSRAYVVLLNAHDSNTSNTREDIAVPNKGKRVRILRVRVIQERADGRHLYEVYFGAGETISSNPDKAVDVLDVPWRSPAMPLHETLYIPLTSVGRLLR